MADSLFFIPDISGYTQFIQSTEIEHSQHVIAELLEVLLEANIEGLQLAEIEGDALFFYKEGEIPSQERLLAQIERMYKAFYSHLKLLETNRICPCNACATAPNLQLKIIAHAGELQFLEVKQNRKPFGKAVIETHRLLKNSVEEDNYVLLSKTLSNQIWLNADYKSKLYNFKELNDEYDGETIVYYYSLIDVENLEIKNPNTPKQVTLNQDPNLVFEYELNVQPQKLYEYISNYRYRGEWTQGLDDFTFNVNEVTRLDSPHTCVINGRHLDFLAVTKEGKEGQLVYGEKTTSPPVVDVLYQFFLIDAIDKNRSKLTVEVYWKAKSPIKRLMLLIAGKKAFSRGTKNAMDNLQEFVNKQTG